MRRVGQTGRTDADGSGTDAACQKTPLSQAVQAKAKRGVNRTGERPVLLCKYIRNTFIDVLARMSGRGLAVVFAWYRKSPFVLSL